MHYSFLLITLMTVLLFSERAQAACTAPPAEAGVMIYNADHNVMQYCNNTQWVGMGGGGGGSGGGAADMVAAFAATTCPAGWSEYTPARGRFLRGIDNGAGIDPSGTRAPGNAQEDAFQGHKHQFSRNLIAVAGVDAIYDAISNKANSLDGHYYDGAGIMNAAPVTDGTNGTPRIAVETRPKNVAVLYCKYDGGGSSLREYKEDIQDLNMGLETVMKLRPVQYMWKKDKGGYADFGFIAEEVQEIAPLLASYSNTGLTGVKYDHMSALLAKAIQDMEHKHRQEMAALLKRIEVLEAQER